MNVFSSGWWAASIAEIWSKSLQLFLRKYPFWRGAFGEHVLLKLECLYPPDTDLVWIMNMNTIRQTVQALERPKYIHTYVHTDRLTAYQKQFLCFVFGRASEHEKLPKSRDGSFTHHHNTSSCALHLWESAKKIHILAHTFCWPQTYRTHICVSAPRIHTVTVRKMWKRSFIWHYHYYKYIKCNCTVLGHLEKCISCGSTLAGVLCSNSFTFRIFRLI